MRIDIVTIFPAYLAPLSLGLVGKAAARGLLSVAVHDLRDWTHDPHHSVDDAPYGGGAGMVMRPEPWWAALTALTAPVGGAAPPRVVVPTPSGRRFDHAYARDLSSASWLVFCCGRYEGIDQRVLDHWATDEISLGDFVLSGGEVAALAIVEAVARLLPGMVGNAESVVDDSFATGLLEGPVYTRPESYAGHDVPSVLRSGDHAAIARWRLDQALERTRSRRPDLLGPAG